MSEHTQKYEIVALLDAIAHDKDGHRLGKVNGIFVDDATGLPILVEIHHGLFGRHTSIVPLRGSRLQGHNLELGFPKEAIKDAPEIDPNFGLDSSERETILSHYGLSNEEPADYFHPVMPELANSSEVGLKKKPADTVGPAGTFADQVDAAEAERLRISRYPHP